MILVFYFFFLLSKENLQSIYKLCTISGFDENKTKYEMTE